MAYTVEFTKDGSSITLPADQLKEIELPSEHSVINEWTVTIPGSPGFEEWAGAEAYIRYDDSLVYRGELESVETGKQSGETVLRGTDTTRKLKRGGADVRYQSIPVWQAIDQYISNQTAFKGEVHEPTADTVDADKVIQSASTTSEFDSAFSPTATEPFTARNDSLPLLQTCWTQEGEDRSADTGNLFGENPDYSDGFAYGVNDYDTSTNTGEYVEWTFTNEYTIPEADFSLFGRKIATDDAQEVKIELILEGGTSERLDYLTGGEGLALGWRDFAQNPYFGDGWNSGDIPPGTHTVRLEATGTTGTEFAFDVIAPADGRFNYNLDNDNGGNGGYLDGPELYPVASIRSVQHKDNYNVSKASVTTTFDDLSGGQAIQASNDGGTNYYPQDGSESNTDSIDVRFSDTYGSLAESKLTLSRYGSRTTATPQEGYQGQTVSSYELSITTNDLAVINDRTYTGSDYENLQQLHSEGGMRFVVPPDESEKRIIAFATGEIVQDETWKTIDYTRSVDSHEYANTVTAYGGKDGSGNRLVATAKDQTAISNDGEEIPAPPLFEPRIDNEDDLRGAARTELSKRVGSDTLTGSVDIAPKRILPGYSYKVPELDNEILALERVTYRIGVDDTGSLDFEGQTDLATEFSRISAGVKSVKDAF